MEGGRTESQAWYLYTHNPVPGKQQDSHKFEASLDYSTRVCLKKTNKNEDTTGQGIDRPSEKDEMRKEPNLGLSTETFLVALAELSSEWVMCLSSGDECDW